MWVKCFLATINYVTITLGRLISSVTHVSHIYSTYVSMYAGKVIWNNMILMPESWLSRRREERMLEQLGGDGPLLRPHLQAAQGEVLEGGV